MDRAEYQIRARECAKRGMDLPQSKLNPEIVNRCREEHERAMYSIKYINDHYSVAALARRYGVSYGAMDKAIRRETWGHV